MIAAPLLPDGQPIVLCTALPQMILPQKTAAPTNERHKSLTADKR
jgi:hypothetical protein